MNLCIVFDVLDIYSTFLLKKRITNRNRTIFNEKISEKKIIYNRECNLLFYYFQKNEYIETIYKPKPKYNFYKKSKGLNFVSFNKELDSLIVDSNKLKCASITTSGNVLWLNYKNLVCLKLDERNIHRRDMKNRKELCKSILPINYIDFSKLKNIKKIYINSILAKYNIVDLSVCKNLEDLEIIIKYDKIILPSRIKK